jgi:DNA-binding CsgD family transcriptional regulator
MIRGAADARASLETLVGEPLEAAELSAAVEQTVRQVLDFDGWCLFGMDAATGLRTAQFGGRGTDFTSDLARNEAEMDDVNRYVDLAHRAVPGGWLSAEHPGAGGSFRFHEVIRPSGFRSELRLLLRDAAGVWGGLTLFHESRSRTYDQDDLARISALAEPLARTMREFPVRDVARRGEAPPAGLIVLAPERGIVTLTEGARTWLDDLVPGGPDDETTAENMSRVAHDAAYAVRRGDHARTATCLRTVRGHWLRVEAIPIRLGDADVAVTLQAASVDQVAAHLGLRCGLTRREREVVQLLVRGEPAKQIARRLGLSVLTVNGHLRSVYRKCRVRGRDELIARMS